MEKPFKVLISKSWLFHISVPDFSAWDISVRTFRSQRHFGTGTFRYQVHFGPGTFRPQRHFGTGTFRYHGHFGTGTFRSQRHFGTGTFRSQRHFGTGTFRYRGRFGTRDISVPGTFRYQRHFGTRYISGIFVHLYKAYKLETYISWYWNLQTYMLTKTLIFLTQVPQWFCHISHIAHQNLNKVHCHCRVFLKAINNTKGKNQGSLHKLMDANFLYLYLCRVIHSFTSSLTYRCVQLRPLHDEFMTSEWTSFLYTLIKSVVALASF